LIDCLLVSRAHPAHFLSPLLDVHELSAPIVVDEGILEQSGEYEGQAGADPDINCLRTVMAGNSVRISWPLANFDVADGRQLRVDSRCLGGHCQQPFVE